MSTAVLPYSLRSFNHARAAALTVSSLALALALTGCSRPAELSAKPALHDITYLVILPTLSDVSARSADLDAAAAALAEEPTEAHLSAAQDAWRAARVPWRSADAFAFGPVVTENLDAAIDWWPAKPETIEEKIASGTTIDSAFVDSLGTSAKGFMAMEYILFDNEQGNAAVLASLSGEAAAPRRAFVAALAENLAAKTEALRLAWDDKQGKYALELSDAGDGSKAFSTEKTAVDELVNQIVFQADSVLNAKIGKPSGKSNGGSPLPDTEESPRSDNSLADMLATLRGLRAVYDGAYGDKDGAGLSDLVRARSADVDDRVRKAFTDAESRVKAIPPPFRTAVTDHPAEVSAAYDSVRALKRTLAMEVVSVLGATLRFNDADGD